MIIRNLKVKRNRSKITITSDFRMSKDKAYQTIFFSADEKLGKVMADATPIVASLLIPAMRKGEDIYIEDSTISEKFYQNIQILMKKLHKWDNNFKLIKIHAKTQPDGKINKKRAMFFTGGVDSFYTYLKAKKAKKKIDYFLYVHGFDIELENTSFYKSVRESITKIAREENIEVITLQTNAKKIIERYVEWDWGHGGALAAVGLLLRNELREVMIAGALRKDQLFPYGTHPEIDYLWGSETVTFIHDGNEYDRLDKVMNVVGKSSLALANLRVCNQNLKGKYNCSKCFKCLWTMMTLECANTLKRTRTFDCQIDLEAVKRMRYTFERNYHLAGVRVIRELQKQKRRKDLRDAIKISLEQSKNPSITQRLAMTIAQLDKKYNQRRLFLLIFAVNKNQDRNSLFKLLSSQGIIK